MTRTKAEWGEVRGQTTAKSFEAIKELKVKQNDIWMCRIHEMGNFW